MTTSHLVVGGDALGILNGDGAGHLNPLGSATRAEIAALLMNFDRCFR